MTFIIATQRGFVKACARWICHHEVLLMGPVVVLLLYPTRWAPLYFVPVPVIWLARRVASGRWTVPTPVDGTLAGLAAMACLGYAIAPDRALGWTRLWHILLGIALAYSLHNWLSAPSAALSQRCRRVGDVVVLGILAVLVVALVGVDWSHARLAPLEVYRWLAAWTRSPGWSTYLPFGGQRLNPRPIAMGLAALLPVPLARALERSGGRRLTTLIAGAALVMILLLQSVQALLGVLMAVLALCALRSYRRGAFPIPIIAFLATGIGMVGVLRSVGLPDRLLSVDDPIGIGVVLRLDIWSRAWAIVRLMPWTGVGLEGYRVLQAGVYPGVLLGPEGHAHNLFLQLALDLGVPGLAAFLWGVAALGLAVVRADARLSDPGPDDRAEVRVLLHGAAAGLVAYLGVGLIDNPWSLRSGLVLWVLLGTVAGITGLDGGDTRAPRPIGRWGPLLVLVTVTCTTLLASPTLWRRNLGSLQAHPVVLGESVPRQRVVKATTNLEIAAARGWGNGGVYRMLARLYAQSGEHAQAMSVLEKAVQSDGVDPLETYAPWEALRARTGGAASQAERWRHLARVYDNWRVRYPDQALWYAQDALLWEVFLDDPARANAIRNAGIEAGAMPRALLVPASYEATPAP